jgi:DNA-binding response OmpR family regulator
VAELGDSRPEPDRTPAVPGSGRAYPTTILLVEDQPELLRALRINLRARQYDVVAARTGREALSLAANHPPDAIILDLGLPDIDGTEVIVELRRWCKAPIIVLSGRTSPGDKILLYRPGQLVGSAQILTGVWGPGFQQRTNYLRFHMARLRRKLEDNPARPRHLLTEPGMGYRYQP